MQIFTLKKWAKYYLSNQNSYNEINAKIQFFDQKIVYVEKTVSIGSVDMEKLAVKNHVTHI